MGIPVVRVAFVCRYRGMSCFFAGSGQLCELEDGCPALFFFSGVVILKVEE